MKLSVEFWVLMIRLMLIVIGIGSLMLDHDRELIEEEDKRR
jgi:hypothetical protein